MAIKHRIFLVDCSWYMHRSFFATVAQRNVKNLSTTTPLHVLSMIVKDASYLGATHIAVCFDADRSFRYDMYPQYKANRRDTTLADIKAFSSKGFTKEVLGIGPYTYMPEIKRALKAAGIQYKVIKKREADDLLGSASLHLYEEYPDAMMFIGTKDKDLMQVVNDRIRMYWPATSKEAVQIIDEKRVLRLKGVRPDQIRDYLCLIGDKVDNIPGVKGIDKGRATKILRQYGTIKACLKDSDSKMGKLLKKSSNRLFIARKLVTLKTDCWTPSLEDCALLPMDEDKVVKYLGVLPRGLEHLHEMKRLEKTKGLFR
jgi:DNA polymerase-1